jgi:hypothetical protein
MIYKNLPNEFGTQYEISNTGIVRNKNGNIVKYNLDERGYPRVRLSLKNIKKSFRIHRLVALAFIDNPNNLPQVNHKDGVKTNNNASNLEWCTNSENQIHAIETGLKITKKGKDSCRFKNSILVYDLNDTLIDELFGNEDMKNKGYDFRNVSAVVLGKRKTYKNLKFKRND